jgi:hypothetical protein
MKINIKMKKEVPVEKIEVEEVRPKKKIHLDMKKRKIIHLLI